MRNRVACGAIGWLGHFVGTIRQIAELGFEGVELFALTEYLDEEDILSRALAETGLQLSAAYVGGSYVEPDRVERELSYFQDTLAILTRLGGRYIIVGGGKVRRGTEADDIKVLVETLGRLGAMAENAGVHLTVHPHAGTLIRTPEEIARVADETDSKVVKFCFDTAHLALGGGDPVRLFKKYADRIAYVHFKDLSNGKFVELGNGELDFLGVYGVLKDHGYDGWIGAELDSSADPKKSAATSLKYLRDKLGIEL